MKANSCNLFIEYGDTVIKSIRDVILMDKVMINFVGNVHLIPGICIDTLIILI